MYLESEDFRLCEGERLSVHFNETFALLRSISVFYSHLQEARERKIAISISVVPCTEQQQLLLNIVS